MVLNLTLAQQRHTDFSPRITVVGVGGAGCNAVNNMIEMGLDGVEFVVANTDAQSLQSSRAERRVQLGPHLTQGLGAGAKAEIGRAAAEEATDDLARHLEGVHMVFITAGMGGGTGTGAAPVVARMARERGVLTVGVVTKPFDFEGPRRRRSAEAGLEDLQQYVDTLIVIPNQNLFRKANERTTFHDAFRMADDVLYMGVRGVTDLMVNPGSVNLDFADIRTIMAEMGKAMMGTGEAEGDERAVKAAEAAISNPLLEDTSMRGAKGLLINITGGLDMTLFEVDEATNRIRREVDEEANIIFGTSIDQDMNGRLRVSVVATGIDAAEAASAELPQKVVAIGGGAPVLASAQHVAPAPGPSFTPRPAVLGRAATTSPAPAAAPPGPMSPAGSAAGAAAPVRMPIRRPVGVVSQPAEAAAPDAHDEAEPTAAEPATRGGPMVAPPRGPVAPAGAASGGLRSLFQQATGLMRRQVPGESAGGERDAADAPARGAPRPQQAEEGTLEIPTFLRRQSN